MDSRPPAYNPHHSEKPPVPANPNPVAYPSSSLYPQMPTFPEQSQFRTQTESVPPLRYQPSHLPYPPAQPITNSIPNSSHLPSIYPPQFPVSTYLQPATTVVTTVYGNSAYPTGFVGFVFEPTKDEVAKKTIEVKYSSTLDMYYRTHGDPNNGRSTAGWRNWVYSETNIFRKVEHDHKKAYLARNPGSDSGRVEWRFSTGSSGKRIKSVQIKFGSKIYKNGAVKTHLETNAETPKRQDLTLDNQKIKFEESQKCSGFSIISELSGGKGTEAWQHAQLFRQALNNNDHTFEVLVKLV